MIGIPLCGYLKVSGDVTFPAGRGRGRGALAIAKADMHHDHSYNTAPQISDEMREAVRQVLGTQQDGITVQELPGVFKVRN